MTRRALLILLIPFLGPIELAAAKDAALLAGFAKTDITPKVGKKPVYLAGFGRNRKATGIHDRLYSRAVVLKHANKKIALVSVDLVGFFYADVQSVRKQLPGFDYVCVSATHNHEGPDTLGIWGPNAITNGIDPEYLKLVESQIVASVKNAEKMAVAVSARIGKVKAPELLHDGREPYVKHDDLIVLEFQSVATKNRVGLLVQWNCHPETLGSKNTEVSADYVGVTVSALRKKHQCPVAYFTGTVGGLMTSLHVPIKDDKGNELQDGTWEKTERFGLEVAERANVALMRSTKIDLTPIEVRARQVFVPLDNKIYLAARQIGVLKRPAFLWKNDPYKARPLNELTPTGNRLCLQTEIGALQLGQLSVALFPGEIYPELVLGKVQDPVDPGADFPKAKIEPSLYKQLPGPHRMIIGLANDEIGYVLPKRQWDQVAPFCYKRKKSQYGEINSIGPDAAPILCEAFRRMMKE